MELIDKTEKDEIRASEDRKNIITLRVPKITKPSVQGVILSLIIVVGLLQTVQLFGLNKVVSAQNVKPAVTSSASSTGSSQLPTMVGGC